MGITRYKIFVGHESLRAFFCYFILTDARKDSCATYFRMGHSAMADFCATVFFVATRILSCDIALNREKGFSRYVNFLLIFCAIVEGGKFLPYFYIAAC